MKQIITFMFFLLLLTGSCSKESRVVMSQLAHVDSLMEVNPQAAYDSLRKDSSFFFQEGELRVKMKYRLLMAKAQNKLYLQMPSDSLFQEVVDYYDANGTSNERMEAHYLMGCVYRDQKESPMAIQCYEKAVECADTLNDACDCVCLLSIYGQMAELYKRQYLHLEAIKACQKYCSLAVRSNDKKNYAKGLWRMSSEYYELGDTVTAMRLILRVNQIYNKFGMNKEAVQVYAKLIYVYLRRGQYEKARYYMNEFEHKSGVFDANNHIQRGKEHYYKAKAMYFSGVNQTDSAEYYYRKLGKCGFGYETAQGLLTVYCKYNNGDSIKKYAALCESEMDRILNANQADAVVQAVSLFDYTRLQKKMDEETLQKEKNKYALIIVALLALTVLCGLYRWYRRYKSIMYSKIERLDEEYAQTFEKLEKAQLDLETLQMDKTQYLMQKQEEIAHLEEELEKMRVKYEQLNLDNKKKILLKCKIVNKVKKAAWLGAGQEDLCVEDWKELAQSFRQWHPILYQRFKSKQLSSQEENVCMLTYLELNNKQMAQILKTSTNVVCNAKQKANNKLFANKSASSLGQNMLDM